MFITVFFILFVVKFCKIYNYFYPASGIVISAFALPIVLTRAPVTAIPPNSTVTDVEGIVSIKSREVQGVSINME